jgi:hypothetical protein
MLRTKGKRLGSWTEIPQVIRLLSKQAECEVCGVEYGYFHDATGNGFFGGGVWRPAQSLHHIFGRRFLNRFKLSPHDRLNIISVCQKCHGKAKKAEERLIAGDIFGFLHAYRDMGFPMSYVWRAAKQYGLGEVLSFFRTESELK